MSVESLLARLLPLGLSGEAYRLSDMGLFLWVLSNSPVFRLELVGLVKSVLVTLARGCSIDVVLDELSRSPSHAPLTTSSSC
jgi:hypothetical protein